MFRNETRGRLYNRNTYREYYNVYGGPATRYTNPIVYLQEGETQSLYGWRDKVKRTRLQLRLNPRPATIMKVQSYGNFIDEKDALFCYNIYGYNKIWGSLGRYFASSTDYPGFFETLPSPSTVENRLRDRALLGAYAKMKSPAFDGMVNLGELRETIKGILNPLSGIRSIVRRIVTKPTQSFRLRSSAAAYTEHMLNQWMEYRYGFMPLYLSVRDALKAAHYHLVGTGYVIQMIHKRAQNPSRTLVTTGHNEALYVPVKGTVVQTRSVTASAALASRLKIDEQRLWGFSVLDVPATVWELIPLSFVVDWFYNVGDWIKAVTPDPSRTVVASSISLKEEWIDELAIYQHMIKNNPATWASPAVIPKFRLSQQRLTRTVNPALPTFPVYDDSSLSWMRQIDSVALLHGRLKPLISKLMR